MAMRRWRVLRPGRSNERGFTMVELLVTMVILAISMTGLTALQLTTIRQVTTSRRTNEATRLAQATLDRFKTMAYTSVPLTPTAWLVMTNRMGQPMQNVAVDGVTSGPYTVQYLTEQLPSGGPLLLTVKVSWLDVMPGNETAPDQRYRVLDVKMTTQRAP